MPEPDLYRVHNFGLAGEDATNAGQRNQQFSTLIQTFTDLAAAIEASLIGGQTGSTDGDILVAKGTSGRALQPSGVNISSLGSFTSMATDRLLGRDSPGAGPAEVLTLSQALDFVGSAANGDLLIRSGGVWTRLGIGGGSTVLTVSAGLPAWVAPAGTTITPQVEVRTASATITIPANATKLFHVLWGAGGGGGGGKFVGGCCAAVGVGGAGGGGGALMKYLSGLTPGNTLALTIGAGGSAGTGATPTAGTAGGNSTLASGTQSITTLTANGGGLGGAGNGVVGSNGSGGTATNGDSNHTGQNGNGMQISSSAAFSMAGMPGIGFGAEGRTTASLANVTGTAGAGFGAGGSGGISATAGNADGGAGANGGALFFWFS